ncbi:MAG TPA: Fe-S cluster assembly protein SufD [Polyangiaceae bacterium]
MAAALAPAPGLFDSLLACSARGGTAEPAWLEARRRSAHELLRTRGLPDNRDEDYRFTPLRRITSTSFAPPPDPGSFSVSALPAELEVSTIEDVLRANPSRLEPYLGALSQGASGFTAANSAGFAGGLCVFVKQGTRVAAPLVLGLACAAGSGPGLCQPRLLLVLEPNSELVLVEKQHMLPGTAQLCNAVSEVFVGDNASLEHVRVQHGGAGQSLLSRVLVRQNRDSRYVCRSFTFGGQITRSDLNIEFAGPGASANLDGLYLGEHEEHVEHHVTVDHRSSQCESAQKYKGLLNDRAHGVFDGAIFVRRGTRGTSAHQENRNILLSPEAVAHTKPRLEIDVDDVKCSHGATVGRLDPAQLFYLRSRGIEKDQAQSLLSAAFAKEMIDRVQQPELKLELLGHLLARLPNSATLGGLT